jgi:hypothetical protein
MNIFQRLFRKVFGDKVPHTDACCQADCCRDAEPTAPSVDEGPKPTAVPEEGRPKEKTFRSSDFFDFKLPNIKNLTSRRTSDPYVELLVWVVKRAEKKMDKLGLGGERFSMGKHLINQSEVYLTAGDQRKLASAVRRWSRAKNPYLSPRSFEMAFGLYYLNASPATFPKPGPRWAKRGRVYVRHSQMLIKKDDADGFPSVTVKNF